MLTITIPGLRLFNERTMKFRTVNDVTLKLEHSLLSISEWEKKWCIPFIESDNPYLRKKEWEKTAENLLDYVRCMTINKDVDPSVYSRLTQNDLQKIKSYMESPMSATFFNDKSKGGHDNHVITSEYIYGQMATLGIPFSCEKWHFNRLMNLIRVCNQLQSEGMGGKGGGPSKMKTMREWAALNAARRKKR